MRLFFRKLWFRLRTPPPEHWRRQLLKLPWLLLLPLALWLKELAAANNAFVETYYSTGVYPVISQAIGFLFGWMPFSAAEMLLYIGCIAIVAYVIYQLVNIFLKKDRVVRAFRTLVNLALVGCAGYFLFIAVWGLNYYRQPLATMLGYKVAPRSVTDLIALCKSLAGSANELRPGLHENAAGVMTLPSGKLAKMRQTTEAYKALGRDFTLFHASYGPPKPVLLSRSLSYTNIEGIYIPLTVESNVNVDMPDSAIASASCHEMAHKYGFAREDEANFIAYLACMASGDQEMMYSGTLLALTTSMNALSSYDGDAYWAIYDTYCDGIKRDLGAEWEYWKQFEGPVAETSGEWNNAYLMSNKQADGVQSYGRMVDLLLAKMQSEKSFGLSPQ
jgi:hypothetical protein